jgi:hypothetical protein
MKRIFLRTIAGTGMILFGLTASIQAQPPHDDDAYHRGRDDYYRGEQWRARMFDHVRDDLNHVQTSVFGAVTGDQFRLDRAKQELGELQSAYSEHRYNERALDDVIHALQRVVSDNRLRDRDRDMLNNDLQRLREFREHHNDWWGQH